MRTLTSKTLIFALSLGTAMISANAQSSDAPKKPDNSAVNKNPGPTADQQKMNESDRTMTAQIRKSITADKSLSTYAHNIKIIAQNGVVMLRGPVRSDDEIKTIMAKATEVAGSADKIDNQLTIAPPKTK